MSSDNDANVINGLFDRLEQTEKQTGARDSNAYQLITKRVNEQPAAPYYMAQTILIQEAALKRLTERVEALEQQVRSQQSQSQQSSGGFLSGIFGGNRQQSAQPSRPAPQPQAAQPGWGTQSAQPQAQAAPSGGRSFLSGALQTATGVAGGMVLGNVLTNMFEGHHGEDIVNGASNNSDAGYDQGYDQGLQDGSYDAGYDDASQQDAGGWGDSQDIGGGDDFGGDDYF